MADSRAPGFLTPIQSPVPDDDELLDLLQPIVAGIGGYPDSSLVRPGWQTPDVPNLPDFKIDWCALRIARTRPDTYRHESHVNDGDGYDLVEYSEEVDLMISCYGPKSQGFARVIRDGFQIAQNRSALQSLDIDTLFVSEPTTLPSLLMSVWVRRVDIVITLRRIIERKYGVLSIVLPPSGSGIDNEHYITPIYIKAAT